jgi:hypothetical protein
MVHHHRASLLRHEQQQPERCDLESYYGAQPRPALPALQARSTRATTGTTPCSRTRTPSTRKAGTSPRRCTSTARTCGSTSPGSATGCARRTARRPRFIRLDGTTHDGCPSSLDDQHFPPSFILFGMLNICTKPNIHDNTVLWHLLPNLIQIFAPYVVTWSKKARSLYHVNI